MGIKTKSRKLSRLLKITQAYRKLSAESYSYKCYFLMLHFPKMKHKKIYLPN